MKKLALILACSLLYAQDNQQQYVLTYNGTTALTAQQPASGGRQVQFAAAWVYCSSASTATLSWNGTAATGTALTPIKIPAGNFPSSVNGYRDSNANGGTTGPAYDVPAGGTFTIDLSHFRMGTTGSGTNLTVTTTNSCRISMSWSER